MNFSFLKNIPVIYLYLLSVISFVWSNVVRDMNLVLYYILLVLGAGFFIFGFFKSRNKRELLLIKSTYFRPQFFIKTRYGKSGICRICNISHSDDYHFFAWNHIDFLVIFAQSHEHIIGSC